MRPGFVIILSLVATTLLSRADEKLPVLKVGSTTYSNVTVTSVSDTDIYFISDAGMANAKLKDLDPSLQKHFHYDPARASAVEKKQAADNIEYHLQLLKQAPPSAKVSDEQPAETASPAPATGKKIWAKSFLGRKAPELIVEKWLTEKPDTRGKFVLIDFWATWCPPCRAAIPELNGFQKQFGDQLVVIGISDESEDAVRRMTDPKIEYSVAIDTQGRTKKIVGVTGIPHVLIIDPQGYVRWEGFPFLKGYELSDDVIAGIIARYNNSK